MSDLTPDKQAACDPLDYLSPDARAWYETAASHARNEDYYRDLCRQIGEAVGQAAYTADDGGKHDSVLNAKLPELVRALVAENNLLRDHPWHKLEPDGTIKSVCAIPGTQLIATSDEQIVGIVVWAIVCA